MLQRFNLLYFRPKSNQSVRQQSVCIGLLLLVLRVHEVCCMCNIAVHRLATLPLWLPYIRPQAITASCSAALLSRTRAL
eukprot:SAG31_NODE_20881_length_563_cov_0.993534_1_plen_78_part_01